VSHEAIYRSLFIQACCLLKEKFHGTWGRGARIDRSRHASTKRNGLGQIKNAVSFSEQPPSVENRTVPGHWEGALIGGSGNSYIARLSSTIRAT